MGSVESMARRAGTLEEAVRLFADETRCEAYVQRVRWRGARPVCPVCGARRIGRISTRKLFRCPECTLQFSVRHGTAFSRSPLPLSKWLVAVWCVTEGCDAISSVALARAIGVQQKSAWRMLRVVREKASGAGFAAAVRTLVNPRGRSIR